MVDQIILVNQCVWHGNEQVIRWLSCRNYSILIGKMYWLFNQTKV